MYQVIGIYTDNAGSYEVVFEMGNGDRESQYITVSGEFVHPHKFSNFLGYTTRKIEVKHPNYYRMNINDFFCETPMFSKFTADGFLHDDKGCVHTEDWHMHEYAEKKCRCGSVFCYTCCGGTNIDQGGKHDPDYMNCPVCQRDWYADNQ